LRVEAIKYAAPGQQQKDFANERDRLIYIIDELVVSSESVPNCYRIFTSTGVVSLRRCQQLHDYLGDATDDRLVRIRNLVSRLINKLSG